MDRRSEGVAKRLSSRKISAPKQFVAGPASSRVNESYFPCNFQVKSALDDAISQEVICGPKEKAVGATIILQVGLMRNLQNLKPQ